MPAREPVPVHLLVLVPEQVQGLVLAVTAPAQTRGLAPTQTTMLGVARELVPKPEPTQEPARSAVRGNFAIHARS